MWQSACLCRFLDLGLGPFCCLAPGVGPLLAGPMERHDPWKSGLLQARSGLACPVGWVGLGPALAQRVQLWDAPVQEGEVVGVRHAWILSRSRRRSPSLAPPQPPIPHNQAISTPPPPPQSTPLPPRSQAISALSPPALTRSASFTQLPPSAAGVVPVPPLCLCRLGSGPTRIWFYTGLHQLGALCVLGALISARCAHTVLSLLAARSRVPVPFLDGSLTIFGARYPQMARSSHTVLSCLTARAAETVLSLQAARFLFSVLSNGTGSFVCHGALAIPGSLPTTRFSSPCPARA